MNGSVVTPDMAQMVYDPWITQEFSQGISVLQGMMGLMLLMMACIVVGVIYVLNR